MIDLYNASAGCGNEKVQTNLLLCVFSFTKLQKNRYRCSDNEWKCPTRPCLDESSFLMDNDHLYKECPQLHPYIVYLEDLNPHDSSFGLPLKHLSLHSVNVHTILI
jgi:hypothetical protein